jgi:hypothetical protein
MNFQGLKSLCSIYKNEMMKIMYSIYKNEIESNGKSTPCSRMRLEETT